MERLETRMAELIEYTHFKIRRDGKEWVCKTVKEWTEVIHILAGRFTDGKDIGGPRLPERHE